MPENSAPLTLDMGAAGVHEMFMSYVRAGFTETQALELIKVHLAAACMTAGGSQ